MNKILEKKQLSENVFYMKFEAADIAKNRKAGQFLIVQVDQDLTERIPLTIADANAEEGWVAIAFQPVGASTYKLSKLNAGDYLGGVLGPLGTPSEIKKYDAPVVCVGGGFGTAPLYPIVQAFKEAGNKVILIEGARTKDLLIFVDEMKAICDEVIICTDDGSAGEKGVTTAPLERLCQSDVPPAEVVAIGDACGLPYELTHKTPSDGLCGKTDEDNFGFSYEVLNKYIRTGICEDEAIRAKIDGMHKKNLFKLMPIPTFNYNSMFE